MRVAALILVLVKLASPADVRIDSAHLRALFGAPIKQHQSSHQDVFTVRPHVSMKVTYGSNDQVCNLLIPAGADADRQAQSVLDQVVPPEVRGKELNRLLVMFGLPEVSTTYYENVVITTSTPGPKGFTSLQFKDPACGWTADQDPFVRHPRSNAEANQTR